MSPERIIPVGAVLVCLFITGLACHPRHESRERHVARDTPGSWDIADVPTRRAGRWDWNQATDVPAGLIDSHLAEHLRKREERVHDNPARLFRVIWYGDQSGGHYYIFDSVRRTDTLTAYRVDPESRRVLERIRNLPT